MAKKTEKPRIEEKKAKKAEEKKSKAEEKAKKAEEKKSKAEAKKAKRQAEAADEELEDIDEKEIENFAIEGLDMEKLKTTVLGHVAKRGDDGMFQSELWKKLKLSSRDGSRLAL